MEESKNKYDLMQEQLRKIKRLENKITKKNEELQMLQLELESELEEMELLIRQ